MKRLLLICGMVALLAPPVLAAKPAPPTASATLTTVCAISLCVMTQPQPGYFQADVWFSGSGYTFGAAYAQCTTGPTSWCGGLYNRVDSSGNISFDIGFVQQGTYTTQVFKQSKQGLIAASPAITYTLVTP